MTRRPRLFAAFGRFFSDRAGAAATSASASSRPNETPPRSGPRAAAARGPLLGGSLGLDLDDALAEVAAAPARQDKNRPNAANNRGRRVIAAQETERFGAVLKDARFRADPLGAVLGHLRATLPPPASAAPAGRRKKGSK